MSRRITIHNSLSENSPSYHRGAAVLLAGLFVLFRPSSGLDISLLEPLVFVLPTSA